MISDHYLFTIVYLCVTNKAFLEVRIFGACYARIQHFKFPELNTAPYWYYTTQNVGVIRYLFCVKCESHFLFYVKREKPKLFCVKRDETPPSPPS